MKLSVSLGKSKERHQREQVGGAFFNFKLAQELWERERMWIWKMTGRWLEQGQRGDAWERIQHSWELGLDLQRKSFCEPGELEVEVGPNTSRLAGGSGWIDLRVFTSNHFILPFFSKIKFEYWEMV